VWSINNNAYKLGLHSTMHTLNGFHVSLLNHCTLPVRGQPSSEPRPVISDETDELEVDCIFKSRRNQKLHSLIQWASWNRNLTSWEPSEYLQNTSNLVSQFHQECLNQSLQSWCRVQAWRYGEQGISLDNSFQLLFLYSLLFSLVRSWTGINSVHMGFTTYQCISKM